MPHDLSTFLRVLRATFFTGSAVFFFLGIPGQSWSFFLSGAVALIAGLMVWQKIDSPESGSSSAESHTAPSISHVIVLAVGYLTMIVAALFLFAPPVIIFSLLSLGITSGIINSVSQRPALKRPAMTKRGWIILLAGCGVILIAVFAYGKTNLPDWAHPETFVLAWLICCQAFRHLHHVASRLPQRPMGALIS